MRTADPSLFITPKSTLLRSVLSNQDLLKNLDAVNMNNPKKFSEINKIGEQIQKAIKNDDIEGLKVLIDKHLMIIPMLKLFIDEAFLDALHLRYEEIIGYMLENGYHIEASEGVILAVCNSLQYLKNDPPVELLELLLKYGANVNDCEQKTCMTGYHISAQYGCVEFAKLLDRYGGDHNAVDNNKKTPLNYATQKGHVKMIEYLNQIGAKDTWKY